MYLRLSFGRGFTTFVLLRGLSSIAFASAHSFFACGLRKLRFSVKIGFWREELEKISHHTSPHNAPPPSYSSTTFRFKLPPLILLCIILRISTLPLQTMSRGVFILLEGVDRCGKTTQVGLLSESEVSVGGGGGGRVKSGYAKRISSALTSELLSRARPCRSWRPARK